MKHVLLFITLGICSYILTGQEYYPLIEEGKTWNVLLVSSNYPLDTSYSTFTYKFDGDTIIDSKEYLKLFYSQEEYPTDWYLMCCIREDSNKRVWGDWGLSEDILMYDFSVEAGDTIIAGIDPVPYVIDSIGLETIDQEDRKKYWISYALSPYYSETWIEGIGSSKGICWALSSGLVGGWYRLLCMHEDQNLIYQNPNYQSCYLITGIDEYEETRFQLYPNPAYNTIMIKNPNKVKIESISLLNMNGQQLKAFDAGDKQLDISNINTGVYIIRLSGETGLWSEKVVIR